MTASGPRLSQPQRPTWVPGWRGIFGTGLALWLASVAVTGLTSNVNMVPTVILLGSFLVPVTGVVWYLDHYQSPELSPLRVFSAFLVGGVFGVLAASLLEAWLLGNGLLAYLGVGFVEEFAKLAALLLVARGMPRRTVRDGVVLGAAVGFGFAALESSGYAFGALLVREGSQVELSLSSLVFTEFLRGVLAPVGHGLWTGILGGVLFGATRNGRVRLTAGVVGTYVLVAVLHGLWDSMRGVALILTALLTARPVQQLGLGVGAALPPPPGFLGTVTTIEIAGLLMISLAALVILWRLWERHPDSSPAGSLPG